MHHNGRVTGYLSVRTKPGHALKPKRQRPCTAVSAKGAPVGLAFHRGLIVRTGLMRWASALQMLPTAWRVRLPLLLLGTVLMAALALSGLGGSMLAGMAASVVIELLLCDVFIEAQVTSPLAQILTSAQRVAAARPMTIRA